MYVYVNVVKAANEIQCYISSSEVVGLILDMANYARYFPGCTEIDNDWGDHTREGDGMFEVPEIKLASYWSPKFFIKTQMLYCIFCDRVIFNERPDDHLASKRHYSNWSKYRGQVYEEIEHYRKDSQTVHNKIIELFNDELEIACRRKSRVSQWIDCCFRFSTGKELKYLSPKPTASSVV